MSQFDDELKKLVGKVKGAEAAVLMGFDGISVAEYKEMKESLPLGDILIEYGRVMLESMKVAQGNNLGALSEMTINTSTQRIVLKVIDANYYVGLFLTPEGNVGQGRYMVGQASLVLKDIL